MTDGQDNSENENRDNRPSEGRLVPAAINLPAFRDPYGAIGEQPGVGPDYQSDFGADLLEYWRIFYKRKWLILSVVAAFVGLGAVRTLMQTPLYSATVRLQIDRNVLKVVESGNISPIDSRAYDFLRTQHQLLQSRSMAERVTSLLNLGEDADFFKPRGFSLVATVKGWFQPAAARTTPDKIAMQRWATGIVMSNRKVRPVARARLVDITFTDPLPSRAQRIANAYADAYIASNLDKRFQANAYAKTFLEDQSTQLKLRLEASEKTLLEFAQKEQIVTVQDKESIALSNLAAANVALGVLVSKRIAEEQQWRQVAKADAIDLPQFLNNPIIDALRQKRNTLVAEYQVKLETFKPSYPKMVQISNKLKEIDRQIAAEMRTIKASLKAAYLSARKQETEMMARVGKLRTKVLDLQKRSIQYNILKREVDTNRKLYDGLLHRLKEVGIAGGVGANNVFIIDKAIAPGAPSSPRLSRALVLSFALGLGAGLAAAFVLERIDDRIRTVEDVERISGLPTLGVIPKVESETALEQDLADPRSALSEAYRSLATALQFSTESGLPKTLLVTSSSPSEGKSVTAYSVARHFATIGLKVLLIDADLRKPSMHVRLGRDNTIGLANYLTGNCTPPEAFQKTDIRNLSFIASGPLPPNAADLLSGSRFYSLLSIGLQIFDLIVIDGPPVIGLADVQLLSNAAEGTIFAAAAGQTRTGVLAGALKRLQLARSPILGVVLTKYDAKAAGYGYGYGYGAEAYSYGKAVEGSKQDSPQLTSTQADG